MAFDHKDDVRLKRAFRQYDIHLKLFMHSDHYVQQRTNQFAAINTVVFALFGALLSVAAARGELNNSVLITGGFVATVGIVLCLIWHCSYVRSTAYRDLHRMALIALDDFIVRQTSLEVHSHEDFLLGVFTLREMALNQEQEISFDQKSRFQIGRTARKNKGWFCIAGLPKLMAAWWIVMVCFIAWIAMAIN